MRKSAKSLLSACSENKYLHFLSLKLAEIWRDLESSLSLYILPYTDREEGDEDTAKSEGGSNYFDDISDDESYLVRQDMSGNDRPPTIITNRSSSLKNILTMLIICFKSLLHLCAWYIIVGQ
jgi:hypothetical protein